jgi:phage RecT family recombinase
MAAAARPEAEPGTTVAKAEPRPMSVADLPAVITSSKRARAMIAPFLPKDVSLERIAATMHIALAKDRAAWKKEGLSPLQQCSPMSVLLSVAKIAQWGLEVGETAHLVPFGTECTPIADYKGLIELIIGSGTARLVEAHCVYEKEAFRLKRGTSTELEHQPIGDPKSRGAMIGAYAMFHLGRGLPSLIEYMSVSEIEEIRQSKSKQWKSGPLPGWYARKTVIRRGAKLLPKNPRLLERLAAMDDDTVEMPAALARLNGAVMDEEKVLDASWDLDDAEPAELAI